MILKPIRYDSIHSIPIHIFQLLVLFMCIRVNLNTSLSTVLYKVVIETCPVKYHSIETLRHHLVLTLMKCRLERRTILEHFGKFVKYFTIKTTEDDVSHWFTLIESLECLHNREVTPLYVNQK